MMKTDNIRIKRKNSDFLLYGILYLLLILMGIFLIGLPFLSFAPSGGSQVFLVILGILCVGAGGTMYGMLLYRGLCPQDALIITNKGMTNHLVGGKEGVYVEWVNVASMKIFGLSKAPMLGLTLEDTESYLSALSGRYEKEARDNLEVGLPVIAIAQRDIFLPIGELKNLFSRMIKGAISWESYSAQGKKADSSAETPAETSAEQPQAKIFTPAPEQPKEAPLQPKATPAEPAPAQEPKHTVQETLLLETMLDSEDTETTGSSERRSAPAPTEKPENQEEIVLLDIDND